MTLVINAPLYMHTQQGKRSFQQTLALGEGEGFVLTAAQLSQVHSGDPVILLDKTAEHRADGTIGGIVPNGWTLNGRRRYDVLLQNMSIAQYQDIPLERWGVAVM